jgi:hypothetical protein
MTAERTYEDYLRDILDHAEKAERFLAITPSAETLGEDERTLFAVVRALKSSERRRNEFRRIFNGSILKCPGEV